jgi:hypothetical protein
VDVETAEVDLPCARKAGQPGGDGRDARTDRGHLVAVDATRDDRGGTLLTERGELF